MMLEKIGFYTYLNRQNINKIMKENVRKLKIPIYSKYRMLGLVSYCSCICTEMSNGHTSAEGKLDEFPIPIFQL